MQSALYRIASFFLCSFLVCGCKFKTTSDAKVKDDSGVKRTTYAAVRNDLENTVKKNGDVARVTNSQSTIGGNQILGVTISNEGRSYSGVRPIVFIAEAMHGNEYLNIADRLIGVFLNSLSVPTSGFAQFIDRGGILLVVPILNPDGYEKGQRRNLHTDAAGYGVDLNRDFDDPGYNAPLSGATNGISYQSLKPRPAVFAEIESKFARDFVQQELVKGHRTLYLTMSHHCCLKYLYYPWETVGGKMSPPISSDVQGQYNHFGNIFQSMFGVPIGPALDADILGSMDRYFQGIAPNSINLTFEAAFPQDRPDTDKPKNSETPSPANSSTSDAPIATPALGLQGSDTVKLIDLDSHVKVWDQIFGDIAKSREF